MNFTSMGGDGASLVAPSRTRCKIFRSVSILFHGPHGQVADVTVAVMTKRRWDKHWRDAKPFMRAFDVGPLIVAVGLTI